MKKSEKISVTRKTLAREMDRITAELTELFGLSVVFSVMDAKGQYVSARVSLPDGQAHASQQMIEHIHVLGHCYLKCGSRPTR